MKVIIPKGNSPRHNFFAKGMGGIEGVEYKILYHSSLVNTTKPPFAAIKSLKQGRWISTD